jgi:hypothetical protein
VVEKFHNLVFSQNRDSVEASVDASARESAHFGMSPLILKLMGVISCGKEIELLTRA